MLKYFASAYAKQFEHPGLAFLLTIALLWTIIGLTLDAADLFHGTVAGFFGVFAIFAAGLALAAYITIFVAKRVSIMRDQMAPHRNDETQ